MPPSPSLPPFSIAIHKAITPLSYLQVIHHTLYSNEEIKISYIIPSNAKLLAIKFIGLEEIAGEGDFWDVTHSNVFYEKYVEISREAILKGKFSPDSDTIGGDTIILLPTHLQPSLKDKHRIVRYELTAKAILSDNTKLVIRRELKVEGSLVSHFMKSHNIESTIDFEPVKKTQSKSFEAGTVTCSASIDRAIAIAGEELIVHCNLFNGSSISISHLEAALYSRYLTDSEFEDPPEGICRIDFGIVNSHSELHSSKALNIPKDLIESSSSPYGRMGLLIRREYFVNLHIEVDGEMAIMDIQIPVFIVRQDPLFRSNPSQNQSLDGIVEMEHEEQSNKKGQSQNDNLKNMNDAQDNSFKIDAINENEFNEDVNKLLEEIEFKVAHRDTETQPAMDQKLPTLPYSEDFQLENESNSSTSSDSFQNTGIDSKLRLPLNNLQNINENIEKFQSDDQTNESDSVLVSHSPRPKSLDNFNRRILPSRSPRNHTNLPYMNNSRPSLDVTMEPVGRKSTPDFKSATQSSLPSPPQLGRSSASSQSFPFKPISPTILSEKHPISKSEHEIEEEVRKTREKLQEYQNLFSSFNSQPIPSTLSTSSPSHSNQRSLQNPHRNTSNLEKSLSASEKRLAQSNKGRPQVNPQSMESRPRFLEDFDDQQFSIENIKSSSRRGDLYVPKTNSGFVVNGQSPKFSEKSPQEIHEKKEVSTHDFEEDSPKSKVENGKKLPQKQIQQLDSPPNPITDNHLKVEEVNMEGSDGSKYIGGYLVEEELKHGKGTLHYPDGNVYAGDFEFGARSGWGVFSTKMYTYDGEFKNDMKHGFGVIIYSNGEQYEGQWEKGYPHGEGCYIFADGSKYVGNFAKGLRDGKGILHYSDGCTCYDGDWKNDKKEGKATVTFPNGKYIGEMRNDVKEGFGKYIYKNGSVYIGEWLNNLKHGRGTFKSQDGTTFVGIWSKGAKDGVGVLTEPNGTTFKEKWKSGRLLVKRQSTQ